jgi:phosphatidylinositol-3-phosphatase
VVLLVLGFGAALGSAIAPATQGAPAETLVLAQPVAAALTPAPTPTPTPTPTATPSPDPTPEETATPEPAATATATRTPKPTPTPTESPTPTPEPPEVEHVFLIVLSGAGGDFAKGLVEQGELISGYAAVAQGELANEVALVSGQDPTPAIAANCPQYDCLYASDIKTVADQLTAAGKTWRAYVEDQPAPCSHADAESYVAWRNPFLYFHSIADSPDCANFDIGLDQLAFDLTSADTTAALSVIIPNRCHDGSGTCAGNANAFLAATVDQIVRSPGYAAGGLIAITSAQGGGLLLISQRVEPGGRDDGTYDHYSLLRSIEDVFGLDHLGHAADPGVLAVFNPEG